MFAPDRPPGGESGAKFSPANSSDINASGTKPGGRHMSGRGKPLMQKVARLSALLTLRILVDVDERVR